MNELEKAAGLSEAAAPAPEVAESVNECVANSEVEANNDAETTEVEKDEIRRIHSLSKEELCAELKAILESGNMEAHREVTAMKQAFFNLKTRETNDQLQTFV